MTKEAMDFIYEECRLDDFFDRISECDDEPEDDEDD